MKSTSHIEAIFDLFPQGRNGEIRYSIRATDASPVQSLEYFYVNPLSGEISVSRPLSEDTDYPANYRVSTSLHWPTAAKL